MMKFSNIDKNGVEYARVCVGCEVTNKKPYEYCNGKIIVFENDHLKQTITIYEKRGAKFVSILDKRKDEIFSIEECGKWLEEHGYKHDDVECRKNRRVAKE